MEHNESTSSNVANTITKKPEIISILKRRNNSSENVGTGISTLNNSLSESNSQTMSEDSNQKYDDDDSDSDWDGCPVRY